MRILFMGTPEFAEKSLDRLYKDGHEICGVIAQPDKPKGRGMKMLEPPVKQCAKHLGLDVYQPETLKNKAILPLLERLCPELIVVVAYGKILPNYVLDYPKYSAINLHGSLLPQYRGAAPIQRSVIDGQRTTGVTTMYMAGELDAGDMILQRQTEIHESETSGELFARLAEIGAELLSETVQLISQGKAPRTPQEHDKATYAKMLKKSEGEINWNDSADKISAAIRGLDPWPCAYSTLCGRKVKLYRAISSGDLIRDGAQCGEILGIIKNKGIEVACGDGKSIIINEVQAEGGKRMSAADFFRGHGDMLSGRFE